MGVQKTPCEKLGYKVGDEFKILVDGADYSGFKENDIVILIEDDGSCKPEFVIKTDLDSQSYFVNLNHVQKISSDQSAQQFKVGDKVKIVRTVESFDPNGMGDGIKWENSWPYEMNDFIGEVGTIVCVGTQGNDNSGYVVQCGRHDYKHYEFPAKALEHFNEEEDVEEELKTEQLTLRIFFSQDLWIKIPKGVYFEVSKTREATTVYLGELEFKCNTDERLQEVLKAIEVLYSE